MATYDAKLTLTADDSGKIVYSQNTNIGPLSVKIKRVKLLMSGDCSESAFPVSCSVNGETLIEAPVVPGREEVHPISFKARNALGIFVVASGFQPGEKRDLHVELEYSVGLF